MKFDLRKSGARPIVFRYSLGLALVASLTADQALCQVAVEPSLNAGHAQTTAPLGDPAARLAEILKIENSDKRHVQLAALGCEMGDTDPVRGAQMVFSDLKHLPDRQVFGIELLRHWAELIHALP